MERIVQKINRPLPPKMQLKKVAAYARVSSEKDAMHHSLSAQISYYNDYIQKHGDWLFAGVFSDEALTGTKDDRAGFQEMLNDCRKGKINMVVTKSISRFARNTVTLLETIRELKLLNIDVYFEKEHIHSLSSDGEMLITLLASFAQAESLSCSENQKWRIRKNFKEGKPWNGTILGYRYNEGVYTVVPDEADIVRRIFREYLSGIGVVKIANGLIADGLKTRCEKEWSKNSVFRILRNEIYTGNLLLQKTFRENHLTKKPIINEGQLPMYKAEGTHEAIISIEDFQKVQEEIKRRSEKYVPAGSCHTSRYPFSGLIVCAHCGKHYRRKTTATGPVWICSTYNHHGRAACPSKQIPENTLSEITADLKIGDLAEIIAEDENTLIFRFKDGQETVRKWKDRSRSMSWTNEMRAEARKRIMERNQANG